MHEGQGTLECGSDPETALIQSFESFDCGLRKGVIRVAETPRLREYCVEIHNKHADKHAKKILTEDTHGHHTHPKQHVGFGHRCLVTICTTSGWRDGYAICRAAACGGGRCRGGE